MRSTGKRARRIPGRTERAGQPTLRFRAVCLLTLCALVCLLGMVALAGTNTEIGLLSIGMPSLITLANATADVQAEQPTIPAFARGNMEILVSRQPQSRRPGAQALEEEPRILIYHTHATEAYMKTEQNPYEASGNWRTKDSTKNVVAVGARLKEELRDVHGLSVVHDTTNHEPPKLSTSYSRSETTMQAYRERYPSIELFIDVHRDAYGTSVTEITDYIELDGRQVARLMFVVGTGKGATGTGFDEMPDFDSNYALAETITGYLCDIDARLARKVRVKTGRYNQHVSDHCLLVEVGHNANSLEQALESIPYLAAGIAYALENNTLNAAEAAALAVWSPA